MMLFQPELGLSVLDLLGRFADFGRPAPLQKNETERDWRGTHPLPLRCLSQFFLVEEKINCLENEFLCVCLRTFHLWGDSVFIMDDHDNFPNLMVRLNSVFPSRVMTPNNMFPCWRVMRYFSH